MLLSHLNEIEQSISGASAPFRRSYTLHFDSPIDLLRHLRDTGVTGTPGNRHKGFNFIKRYRETFGETQEITLTYCPVYIIAHKKKPL